LLVDDMCPFEGTTDGRGGRLGVERDAVRQFSLVDAEGAYDHMEHLRLTISYVAAEDESGAAASPLGGIWSGADIDAWAAEVEALPLLAIPADPDVPAKIEASLERV